MVLWRINLVVTSTAAPLCKVSAQPFVDAKCNGHSEAGQCCSCWRRESEVFHKECHWAYPCFHSRCQDFWIVQMRILAVTLKQRPSVVTSHHHVGEKMSPSSRAWRRTLLPRHNALWECFLYLKICHMAPECLLQTFMQEKCMLWDWCHKWPWYCY